MPIGAAIGGGVIAAGGSVLAGSQASRAQRDAARTASDTTLQSTRENNALLRETRDQNLSIATPFMNNGLAAGNALTDLLLGTNTYQPTQAGSAQVGGALSGFSGGAPFNQWDAYLQANPDLAAEAHRVTADGEFASPADYAQWHYQHYGQQEGRQLPSAPAAPATPTPATTPAPATGGAQPANALGAFDRFREGTNYQFRLGEGQKLLDSKYATAGAFDSGAERKALLKYGQNFASNELSNYMNLLASQQASGISAAGAVMGVNTNYAGNVTAQNTNAANAASNAALAGGQASANMWGTIGNTAGQLGGALFQYGMGQFRPQSTLPPAGGPTYGVNTTPNYYTRPFG
jgi:hypothetical protein